MRSVPVAALALLACPLFAQAPYVEKIEVSVVNVDVTVTDHGKPVHGLTRDDFEILEDGVSQTISNFYVVENSGRPLSGQPGAAVLHDERFRRKVLLIIDRHSMTPYERDRALARIEDFINDQFRGGEYDWSIAAVDSSLRMLLPPTSDKTAIHTALDAIRHGVMPPRLDQADPNSKTALWEATLAGQSAVDAVIEATHAFASASGKKIVLLLSSGLLPNDWHISDLKVAKAIAETRNDLIREANASNVNLYIINPEGVGATDPAMYWAAQETGGKLLPGNRVAQSLQEFDAGSSNFYSLGYRPSHPDDGVYHRIHVRLRKGDYALQYRDGYAGLPGAQQVERTLDSPFGTFMISGDAIPVTVNFDQRREVEGGVEVTMKTAVPADKLTFLPNGDGSSSRVDIVVSLFDTSGRNVFSIRRTRDAILGRNEVAGGTFNEATEFFVERGKPYRVVVAVRDAVSEAVGVTQTVVEF